MRKKIVLVVMSAVVAISLMPAAAFASTTSAGTNLDSPKVGKVSKKCLNHIEGWWKSSWVNYSDYRHYNAYAFIHKGKIYWFNSPTSVENTKPKLSSFKYASTVNVTSATRFKYGKDKGWKINTTSKAWAYYLIDGNNYMEMYGDYPNGYYSQYGMERMSRKGLDSLLKKSPLAKAAKSKNPFSVKATSKSVNASDLQSSDKKVGSIKVSRAYGKVSYKNVSKSSKAKKLFTVSPKGAVTAKQGTPKGTYTVNVKVTCKKSFLYKTGKKTVSLKIKVS